MRDLGACRALLFTPGNRPERFAKAAAAGADAVILDLEDAVSLADKDPARSTLIGFFGEPRDNFGLRVNNIHTPAGVSDSRRVLREMLPAAPAPLIVLSSTSVRFMM